ncbi:MAG: hypothetical protein ACKPAH_10910, partial [Verrucomicrobiota bacterium]
MTGPEAILPNPFPPTREAALARYNGPLQTLNRVLRLVKLQDLSIKKMLPELEKNLENLNQELRGI